MNKSTVRVPARSRSRVCRVSGGAHSDAHRAPLVRSLLLHADDARLQLSGQRFSDVFLRQNGFNFDNLTNALHAHTYYTPRTHTPTPTPTPTHAHAHARTHAYTRMQTHIYTHSLFLCFSPYFSPYLSLPFPFSFFLSTSLSLSIYLYIYIYIYLSLSTYLALFLSPSTSPPISLSIYLSLFLSPHLFLSLIFLSLGRLLIISVTALVLCI